MCAPLLQSCLSLCNPKDCSPPGSSVHGILQARILEQVAMPSSRGSSRSRDQTWISCTAGRFFTTEPPRKPACCRVSSVQLSHVQLFVTPWTAACQASLYITNFQSLLKPMSSGGQQRQTFASEGKAICDSPELYSKEAREKPL